MGIASVIDADTIEIHGIRVRLVGIDAPESEQSCQDTSGLDYRCGQQAALVLADHIAGRLLECKPEGTDRYGRTLAVCWLGAEDINGWLVSKGWALAYRQFSGAYTGEEAMARAAKRGIWAGGFTPPWEWRQQN